MNPSWNIDDRPSTWDVVRGRAGGVVTQAWRHPGGNAADKTLTHLFDASAATRGGFLQDAAGGFEDCTWEGTPLMQFPLHPKAGDRIAEAAACTHGQTRFTYQQTLTVVSAQSATVNGAAVAAWKLHRTVDDQLAGDRNLTSHREGDEVWLADGSMVISADTTQRVKSGFGTDTAHFLVTLDRMD